MADERLIPTFGELLAWLAFDRLRCWRCALGWRGHAWERIEGTHASHFYCPRCESWVRIA